MTTFVVSVFYIPVQCWCRVVRGVGCRVLAVFRQTSRTQPAAFKVSIKTSRLVWEEEHDRSQGGCVCVRVQGRRYPCQRRCQCRSVMWRWCQPTVLTASYMPHVAEMCYYFTSPLPGFSQACNFKKGTMLLNPATNQSAGCAACLCF